MTSELAQRFIAAVIAADNAFQAGDYSAARIAVIRAASLRENIPDSSQASSDFKFRNSQLDSLMKWLDREEERAAIRSAGIQTQKFQPQRTSAYDENA